MAIQNLNLNDVYTHVKVRFTIPIIRLPAGFHLPLPEYQTTGAAGMDLSARIPDPVNIEPGDRHLVPCGFSLAIPPGYEGQIRPRSGLANRYGVTVLNAPGTIDSDYRGEVQVLLINHGRDTFVIEPDMRIAQLVVSPVSQVVWDTVTVLPKTDRDDGGFGHTGT